MFSDPEKCFIKELKMVFFYTGVLLIGRLLLFHSPHMDGLAESGVKLVKTYLVKNSLLLRF